MCDVEAQFCAKYVKKYVRFYIGHFRIEVSFFVQVERHMDRANLFNTIAEKWRYTESGQEKC